MPVTLADIGNGITYPFRKTGNVITYPYTKYKDNKKKRDDKTKELTTLYLKKNEDLIQHYNNTITDLQLLYFNYEKDIDINNTDTVKYLQIAANDINEYYKK